MRDNSFRALGLAACIAVTCGEAAHGAGSGGQKTQDTTVAPRIEPPGRLMIQAHAVPPDRVHPLRSDQPVEPHDVASASGRGTPDILVYSNTEGTLYWAPGADVLIADDIETTELDGCDLTSYEILVTGGGDGSGPGFTVNMALYDACPGAGGQIVTGTEVTRELPDDGVWPVSLDRLEAVIAIPGRAWLGVWFSTSDAGWVMGEPAEVGSSEDRYDDPQFPCSAFFGGYPVYPHASFYCTMYCWAGPPPRFVAYRADAFDGGFWPGDGCVDGGGLDACGDGINVLHTCEAGADDIEPIVGDCLLVSYEVGVGGLLGTGPFEIEFELWTDAGGRPGTPIPGTTCCHTVLGNGFLETAECPFDTAVQLPPTFWLAYQHDESTHGGGMLIASDWPGVGFSNDCFALYGEPEADQWSECVWRSPAGCAGGVCATFLFTLWCAGEAPTGACCHSRNATCADDVMATECTRNRWAKRVRCADEAFDPPCGTAACCKIDPDNPGFTICEEMLPVDCAAESGDPEPGVRCADLQFGCGLPACIGAQGDCFADNQTIGCVDRTCCNRVCNFDAFCCTTAWDDACLSEAEAFCDPPPPANDLCIQAIPVAEGSYAFSTISADTDGPDLDENCQQDSGSVLGQDIWYDYTPTTSGLATVSTCDAADYDIRIAAYTGCDCPVRNDRIAGCDDDGCGGEIPVPSVMTFPVTGGNCYKLRIGGWQLAQAGTGTMSVWVDPFGCPSGAVRFVDPPGDTVDAGQPHAIDNTTPLQGIDSMEVEAPQQAGAACWSLCETGDGGLGANNIAQVADHGGGAYTISLIRAITPGAVTTLTYAPDAGLVVTASFIAHPANADGSARATPADVLAVIDYLSDPGAAVLDGHHFDIDRSGLAEPGDILRLIDLLNGADTFDAWNDTDLPVNDGSCP